MSQEMDEPENDLVTKCKRLMEMTGEEDTSIKQISQELASQNEILSEVLKRVNSIEFGFEMPITDPTHATSVLGGRKLNEVLNSVIVNQLNLAKQSNIQKDGSDSPNK